LFRPRDLNLGFALVGRDGSFDTDELAGVQLFRRLWEVFEIRFVNDCGETSGSIKVEEAYLFDVSGADNSSLNDDLLIDIFRSILPIDDGYARVLWKYLPKAVNARRRRTARRRIV
jgi:hypothetical protein